MYAFLWLAGHRDRHDLGVFDLDPNQAALTPQLARKTSSNLPQWLQPGSWRSFRVRNLEILLINLHIGGHCVAILQYIFPDEECEKCFGASRFESCDLRVRSEIVNMAAARHRPSEIWPSLDLLRIWKRGGNSLKAARVQRSQSEQHQVLFQISSEISWNSQSQFVCRTLPLKLWKLFLAHSFPKKNIQTRFAMFNTIHPYHLSRIIHLIFFQRN